MIFIEHTDMQNSILEMLNSNQYKEILHNSGKIDGDNKEFQSGAMFGAAMAAIYVETHTKKYEFPCREIECQHCAHRKSGHPELALPCKATKDDDFCSYFEPASTDTKIDTK